MAHILEAIERIDSYTGDMNEGAFLDSQLVQDAVIRNFEIIGEASNNIEKHYPEFAAANPELPLAFAYQMRNATAGTAQRKARVRSSKSNQPPRSGVFCARKKPLHHQRRCAILNEVKPLVASNSGQPRMDSPRPRGR